MENSGKLKGSVMLLITAVIWGCAFVAQKSAMDYVGPFTFQSVRSLLGGAVLIPVIILTDGAKKKSGAYRKNTAKENAFLIKLGILCGTVLCIASCLQQIGLSFEGMDSGKAGFITAMYILLVPIFGIFTGRRPGIRIWACVFAAAAGLYLLCMNGKASFSLGTGDILEICCAVVFSLHIIIVDKWGGLTNGVKLSCIQFFVSGILAGIPMLIFERPDISVLFDAWLPICYAGVMSCGIAYTLQILGQKYVNPTVASLLMSLESVFAVLGGVVLLHERMSVIEYAGCILMFAAIVVSQLPSRKKVCC